MMKKLLFILIFLLMSTQAYATLILKADTGVDISVGPFMDISNAVTPETGITLGAADQAELLKPDGAATVDISGRTWAAVTGADGWYDLTLTTADTNTEGPITIVIQDASVCLPVFVKAQVVNANVYDSIYAAATTDYLQVDLLQMGGGAQSATDLKDFADAGYNPATDKIVGVVLTDTATDVTNQVTADTTAISGDATAADNLESACDNYSATRGLTGTAVPAVAADGAGGLPVSDAGGLDLDTILDVAVSTRLAPTVAARTLDVTTGGTAGINWNNLENPTTTVDLSDTSINLCDTVTTNTDLVSAAAVVNEWETQSQADPTGFHVNLLEIGGDNQSQVDLKDFADDGYVPGSNKVQGVVLVDTTTTNTDMVTEPPTVVQNRQEMDSNSTELAKIGTIPALDGGGQTIGAAIAKLADDNGGADYDAGTDSLEMIRNAIVDANPQNHSATANNETTGTLDAGTYVDTATINTTYYQTTPAGAAVGGFGLNVDLTFGIGTGRVPSQVEVTGYFDSGALRTVQVWAYDYNAADWVQLSSSVNDFGNAVANESFQYPVTNNMVQVSDGEVQIRFTSTSINTGDDWYCDYVNVTSVAQEAAGLTADAVQQAVWARDDNGHDEDTLGYNLARVHLVHGDIASATDASQFIIDTGVASNDAYNGMLITMEDKTDNHYELRRIVDYIGATKEVFVDRVFSFTPVASDDFYIMNAAYADVNTTHSSGTAQTANDNGADINAILVDTAEIGAAGIGLTEAGDDGDHLTAINLPNQTMDITGSITGNLIGDVTGNVDGTVTGKTPAEAGDSMNLAADAIKAASYDESTAFPLKADDAGATQIARVGADGDTLETLSDQIDAVPTAAEIWAVNFSELSAGVPDATPSAEAAIMLQYMALRNRGEQVSDEYRIFNDSGVTITECDMSDDGTTFVKDEYRAID